MKRRSDLDRTRSTEESTSSIVRRRTLRRVRQLLLTGAAVGVYACDGTVVADPLPPPPSTTIPADTASIVVEVLEIATGVDDGGKHLVAFELRLRERSGSVGANINFVRAELVGPDGELVERQEIGAGKVREMTGSNRLEPNEERFDVFFLGFSADIKRRPIRVTVGFGDDRGNEINIPNTVVAP